MKRTSLTLSILLILFAGGVWAEEIYLNCERIPKYQGESIFLLDLEKKTSVMYLHPSFILSAPEDIRHLMSIGSPYKLKKNNYLLNESSLNLIELGFNCDWSACSPRGFTSLMTIDRTKLILTLGSTSQCKLLEKYDYQQTLKEWQTLLDKEKEGIKSKRKF